MYTNREKCDFRVWKIEYLGYLVDDGEVKIDPVKTKTVLDWPKPMYIENL